MSRMHNFYITLLANQRKWIADCEAGISYLGPNGQAIREADENELRRIQDRLKTFKSNS